MEVNGNMTWDRETEYINYLSSLNSLENLLNINKFDIILKPELAPYVSRIVQYINSELIKNYGLESNMKDKLDLIFELYNMGIDKILDKEVINLALSISNLFIDNESDELFFDKEFFILSWTNIFTYLITIIRINYSYLFIEKDDVNCPCVCTRGDNQNTWDNYFSNVWPEDENNVIDYDNETDIKNKCTCNYRIN